MGSRFSPGCCCDTCTRCDDGAGPDQFKVTLSGFADNGCLDCGDLNGDYFLDRSFAGATCEWRYDAAGSCDFTSIILQILRSGSDVRLDITLSMVGSAHYDWSATYPAVTEVDCEFVAEAIEFDSDTDFSNCIFDGSAAIVNAV